MGYRSEFALVLGLRAEEAMYCLLEGQSAETKQDMLRFLFCTQQDCDDSMLHADGTKWHTSYNKIQFLECCIEHFDKKNLPYRFLRIGEDQDGTEAREIIGNEEEEGQMTNIYLVRTIEIEKE